MLSSETPKDSSPVATTRSAVSNGSQLLVGVDGRTSQARRYRDILEALREHLGGNPSATQEIIARRAATLAAWAEAKEAAALAEDGKLDIAAFHYRHEYASLSHRRFRAPGGCEGHHA